MKKRLCFWLPFCGALLVAGGLAVTRMGEVRAYDLAGSEPHSVWTHHAADLVFWVGICLLIFCLSFGWYYFHLKKLKHLADERDHLAEQFRQTLKSIADGVIVLDMEQRIVLVNRSVERQFNCSRVALDGRNIDEIFKLRHESGDEKESSPVDKVMATCATVEFSEGVEMALAQGRCFYVAGTASPIRNDAGDMIGVVLIFRDISRELERSRELHEAQLMLQILIDNLPCIFWLKDSEDDFRYLLVNDHYYTAMQIPVEKRFVGKTDFDFHAPDCAEKYRNDDIRVMESGKRWELYEEYEDSNGVRHSIHTIKLPLLDAMKDRKILLGMSFDITEIVDSRNREQVTKQLLQAIQDSLPCTFFVKDADDDFRYLMCNRNYADFLSSTCAEIQGKTDADLYATPEDIRSCRASDQAAIEQGYSDADETLTISGETRTFRCIKSRLVRDDGHRLLLGICVEITREKQLQTDLREAVEKLELYAEQEHLLNNCLKSALQNEDEATAIRFVLEIIGERLRADHAYCFRYDYSRNLIQPVQEWQRNGGAPLFDTLSPYAINQEEGWFKLFLERKMLCLPDVSMPEAQEIHGHWTELVPQVGVKSLYAISIRQNRELWGHIGFSYMKQKIELTESELNLLHSCNHIIEMILERRKSRDEFKRSEYEKLLLMDSIRIPIMLFDSKMNLIRCNNAALEVAEVPETQVYRQECWQTFCGNECRPADCPVARAGQDCREHSRELRIRERDYLLNAYPIIIDGNLVYIMKTMVDITELNALLKNQQAVNFCLETMLAADDMERAIDLTLEAVARHIGATRSYILQFNATEKTISSVAEYTAPGREAVFKDVNNIPYSAKPDWIERFRSQPDIILENMQAIPETEIGSRWAEYVRRNHTQSLFARRLMIDTEIWGYIGLAFEDEPHHFSTHDEEFISAIAHFIELMLQRRRSQRQILDALAEAQDANRAKSYFLATMSHELRTPLNAVIGFSELLQTGQLSAEEQHDYLRSINLAGTSLLSLINDVLDLSKLEAEQLVLSPQLTNLQEMFQEIQAVFLYKVNEKNLSLDIVCPEDLPVLKLDSMRLRQILLNLVGNAVKFTSAGSISVHATVHGDCLRIAVRDTGSGIPQEAQQKIFEPFVQSDPGRDTHVYNGTGLGLAISQRLPRRMGGVIRLESAPGEGSCFMLELHHLEPVRQDTAGKPSADSDVFHSFGKMRVLLVDDVPMNLKVLGAMLRKLNIECRCAGSGAEALEILKTDQKFSAILTDLWMPEMNGEELALKIRAVPGLSSITIIAVTADSESGTNFKQDVFDRILLKPITLEKIQELLTELDSGTTGHK